MCQPLQVQPQCLVERQGILFDSLLIIFLGLAVAALGHV
jgi:hypothetical protein